MQLRDQFWDVLKKSRPGRQFGHVSFLTEADETREFQLFEVLVVDALSSLDPGLQWRIKGSHDGEGIDFQGTSSARAVNIPKVAVQRTLLGRTRRDALVSVTLLDDIETLVAEGPSQNVAGVILVVGGGGSVSREELERLSLLSESTEVSATRYFLDACRFEEFWAAERPRVLDILDRCLTENERQVLAEYLGSVVLRTRTEVVNELDRDAAGQTGKPLHCRLRLGQKNPMPRVTVRVHFKRPEEGNVEVVLPSKLAGPGVDVDLEGGQITETEIWLRCLAPGKWRLGGLEIRTLHGVPLESIDLGACDFQPVFEPPYFSKPNSAEHEALSSMLRETMNGAVRAVKILGAGGSGKSKFCEAVGIQAVDLGFSWIPLAHRTSVTAHRRLIYDLLGHLLGGDGRRSLSETLIERLKQILSPFPEDHRRALVDYLEDRTAPVAVQVVAASLFGLISESSRRRPLLIHLHDLHWADDETLAVLGETIDLLERSQARFRPGVLFLLEGRDRESLRLQSGLFRPPEHWIAFLDDRGYRSFTLSAWSLDHSRSFLDWVLDYRRAASPQASASRLPLFEQLRGHILESSAGNPMHIVEQLKALIDREHARVSERGTVYLSDRIPQHFQTPQRTDELIGSRLDFLRSQVPAAADLLAVMAKIGRRVPGPLFRFVCSSETDSEMLAGLYRVDMSNVPRHAAEEFEFVHENYYLVCRDARVSSRSQLLRRAIAYFEDQQELTPNEHFDAAFLMAHLEVPESSSMLEHATTGLQSATKQNDDRLCLEFCRFLLDLPPKTLAHSRLDPADLRLEQGVREKHVANWNDSLATLKQAEQSFAERGSDLETLVKRLNCKADIVNALVTLMRTDDALSEVDAALHLIEVSGAYDATPSSATPTQQLAALRERFWHRRAVTLWYDGRHVEAAKWQRLAYASARQRGDLRTQSTCLREFGTLLLHRNPVAGRRRLEQGIELLRRSGEQHHEPFFLLEAELLIADLLIAHWVDERANGLGLLKRRAETLHFRCQEKAGIYEAPMAALVAGAVCGLTDRLEEAHHWFKLATSTAMRARSYDQVWKGRLNLGQVCLALRADDEARIHATEAARILRIGLSHGNWRRRAHRRVMLSWPVRQCLRVHPSLTSELAPFVVDSDWSEDDGSDRPGSITGSGEPAQVLHLRQQEADYYLLE